MGGYRGGRGQGVKKCLGVVEGHGEGGLGVVEVRGSRGGWVSRGEGV